MSYHDYEMKIADLKDEIVCLEARLKATNEVVESLEERNLELQKMLHELSSQTTNHMLELTEENEKLRKKNQDMLDQLFANHEDSFWNLPEDDTYYGENND